MLSNYSKAFDSVCNNRVILNSIKRIVSRGTICHYMAGSNIPIAGGIHMKDGVIELPEQLGPLYSKRKEKCGVVAINNQRVRICFSFDNE